MFIPAVIPAGDPYGWNNLTGTINGTNYSGTITFSSDVGGSSPITSVSGNIPGGGGNQSKLFMLKEQLHIPHLIQINIDKQIGYHNYKD